MNLEEYSAYLEQMVDKSQLLTKLTVRKVTSRVKKLIPKQFTKTKKQKR